MAGIKSKNGWVIGARLTKITKNCARYEVQGGGDSGERKPGNAYGAIYVPLEFFEGNPPWGSIGIEVVYPITEIADRIPEEVGKA